MPSPIRLCIDHARESSGNYTCSYNICTTFFCLYGGDGAISAKNMTCEINSSNAFANGGQICQTFITPSALNKQYST